MCDVAAPPSPVFSTQFTLPPQMGEYDTVGALVQVPLQLVHWGHLQGQLGTVLVIPLNQDLALNEC